MANQACIRRSASQPNLSRIHSFMKSWKISDFLYTLWLFTESDTPTFVIPNTLFGIFGALSGTCITQNGSPNSWEILLRLPTVLVFNWSNLLIFDLANQRTPESVVEDSVNKPWRPLPAGMMTTEQARRLTMISIPLVLLLNDMMGTVTETLVLFTLTWLYNDLKGGDGLGRNAIIAVAFGFYNLGSLRLAAGINSTVSTTGIVWIIFISGVILTTMHVQDLKDQVGDAKRGRRTLPLVLGNERTRRTLASFIVAWSCLSASLWMLRMPFWIALNLLGSNIAYRIIRQRTVKADARSWRLWCAWTAALYACPLLPSAIR